MEGYYGEAITPFTERNLHYFLLEIEGGVLLNAGSPEVSVTRPQCRQRNGRAEYNVLGNTHDPNSGTVTVRNNATNALLGTAAVAADADDPTFGAYNFRRTLTGACATRIKVLFPGAPNAVADVEVRID